MVSNAAYITFTKTGSSSTGRTDIYSVNAKADGFHLGEVRWFGRWSVYAFFPTAETVFEKRCLRDIAQFCEDITREQRRAVHAAKQTHAGRK